MCKGTGHYVGTLADPENSDDFQHTYDHHLAPYQGDYYPTGAKHYDWKGLFHTSVLKNYGRHDFETSTIGRHLRIEYYH